MQRIPLLACLLLSGCASSMVRSYPAVSGPPQVADHLEYVGEYGLPTSQIEVTVTGASAGGGDEKDATPGVNFNSVITVNTAAARPEEEKKDPAEPKAVTQASVCADIRKTYNADRVAQFASFKRHTDFLLTVQTWRVAKPTTNDEKTAALKTLGDFVARRAQDTGAAERAQRLLKLVPDCPQPIKVELKEVVQVDPAATYRLYATPAWMADNNVTVEQAGGYLKTINATAEDRTADVITEAARSIGTIKGFGMNLPAAAVAAAAANDAGLAGARVQGEANFQKAVAAIRAKGFTDANLQALERALALLLSAFNPELLPEIDAPLPITRVYTLAELASGLTVDNGLGLKLKTVCSNSGDASRRAIDPATKKDAVYYNGVLTSATRSCVAAATRTERHDGVLVDQPMKRIEFPAVDAHFPAQLTVGRQAFVKTSSIYSFEGGRLTKSEIVRPAPLPSFAAVPGKAIGALVEGMVGGLNGRKSQTEAETNRVDAEIKRIKKAQEYQDLKAGKSADNGEEEPDDEADTGAEDETAS